jgi:hypothetical protein
MHDSTLQTCDGCGQPATSVHLAKRFERLEWTTRYRPVHIGAVLLGAMAPAQDEDFLYSPSGEFSGEAGKVLEAAGISRIGKGVEGTLEEFQRRGLFLTYVLECPLEPGTDGDVERLLNARFAATAARIRRSLRPKRVIPISRLLEPLLHGANGPVDLGRPIVAGGEKVFSLDDGGTDLAIAELRRVLSGAEEAGRG